MRSTLLCLAAALAACSQSSEPAAGGSDTAEALAPTNRIEIPATVRKNLGITFAKVEPRHVARTLRVPGAFELRSRARREYRMALSGRVELLVDQYERVEVDQPLFRFQSPTWPELLHEILDGEQAIETARAEIEVGQARIDESRRKLELVRERLDALAQAEFKHADLETQASELEASLPRLQAELRLAETHLANANRTREHALHRAATATSIPEMELVVLVPDGDHKTPRYMTIDWIEVRAVVPGVVEHLAVTDGAFVEPPAAVLSTIEPDQVRFRALALQADLPALTGAVTARIVPPRSPGIPFDAGVAATTTLGLEAHPEERTLTLLASPQEQAPWIRPGVSAFLEVELESTGAPALAVPRSAIVQDGLAHYVFRRDPADPNVAIRVEADMGIDNGSWVVLESGVMRGDQVVLDGAYELKLAMQERRGGAGGPQGGHVHADGTVHDDH